MQKDLAENEEALKHVEEALATKEKKLKDTAKEKAPKDRVTVKSKFDQFKQLNPEYRKLKKEKVFSYIKINDYDILSKISVKDVQKEHKTDISFEEVKVDTEMNEKIFQEKSLKRLPPH